MRPTIVIRWRLAFAVLALTVVVAARPAGAGEADPQEPAAETSEPAVGPDAEARYAKGEALYDGEWMPVEKLFGKYREKYDRFKYIEKHGTDSQQQLNELNREMAQIRGEERKAEQPVRRELGMARQQLRKYNHILREKPPAKPDLQRLPSPPTRPTHSRSRSRSSSDSYSRSRDDWYDRARRQWQQRCDQIRRQNKMKMERYRREMEEYQKKRNEAKQEVPKLQAQAKELMKKLDKIEQEYDNKAAPTRNRSESAVEQVRAHGRRMDVLEHEVEQLAEALRAVPEPVRCKHGIVEFEEAFHSIETLEHQYREQQREVDRVREKLQAECKEIGIPFPENWRHPQQDRLDEIKALMEKVEQAKAASG